MKLLSRHKNIKLHNEWWCFLSSVFTYPFPFSRRRLNVESFVWLPCHKESKESKENSNWIELIDTLILQRNFYFSCTHTHTQPWEDARKTMMTMQLLMIKNEILRVLSLHTLRRFLNWNSFVRYMSQCLTSCCMRSIEYFKKGENSITANVI